MTYTIRYEGNIAMELSFLPNWVSSDGHYWSDLGRKALSSGNFHIPNWNYTSDGGLAYVHRPSVRESDTQSLVEEAQQQVTKLMDKLLEWDNIRKIFQELNK